MGSISCVHVIWALLLAAPSLPGQNVNTARPQEISAQKHLSPEEIRDRLCNAQLQKDSDELAQLCSSVGSDMEGLKKGLVPKDMLDRLKRMEKLSRHLREQLGRIPPNQ